MSSNMRTKWVGSNHSIDGTPTEIRMFEGKIYEAKVFMDCTNVLAQPMAEPGQTAPSEGISFPWREWKRLPLSNAPVKDIAAGTHP